VALVRALVVGLYAWLVAVSFGLAWLDSQYARLVPGASDAFREVADFLMFITLVTVLAGIGAVGLSWNSRAARNLLVASLLVVLVVPFVALLILSPEARESSATGSIVRLSIGGVASVLAFAGFHRIGRSG
jgi:glucose dehydrogenase